VWVVWALAALCQSPLGEHLVFKGGTSLSKAYGVIRRFSEDVDLTYDIRTIAPDLVGPDGETLPKTRSEEKRWSNEVRRRLPDWVAGAAQRVIAKAPAIPVFCLQERLRGDRFARHWHDVVRLDETGFATAAFADRDLAQEAARNKSMFFAERAADRSPIDYAAAIGGGLRLCSRWRRSESSGARLCPYGRARPTVGRCRGLRGAHGAMRRYRGAGQPEGHMKGKDAGRGPVLRTREPHPRAMRGIAAGDHRRVSSASFAAALE
jgi:hypothetical protein